jgi:hypothetical protein
MRKATRLLIFVLTVIVTLVSCSVSVRPVYEDQEQALAQIAVEQFHERYNRRDYDGLYAMMAKATQRVQPKETAYRRRKRPWRDGATSNPAHWPSQRYCQALRFKCE